VIEKDINDKKFNVGCLCVCLKNEFAEASRCGYLCDGCCVKLCHV